MQKYKLIILPFLAVYILQIAQAKNSSSVDISDAGPKALDAAKIMFNGLPVLMNKDKASAISQNVKNKIKQDLRAGKITGKEANLRLRENCMGMINNPKDKIESFLGSLPITGFLKDLDLLCHQYK